MNVACSSGAFHQAIASGALTQLEFVDACAAVFRCDGVAFDARHFPRDDGDYLAQLKKLSADRGLAVAALADASLFASETAMPAIFERAVALGAPVIAAPLGTEIERSWSEMLTLLGAATSLAKRYNVTIALRNAPGTFAATTHDCKRVSKEADSAWLRYGPEPLALDAASDARSLAPNTVLLWSAASNAEAVRAILGAFAQFCGHVVLDRPAGDATVEDVQSAVRAWHTALAERELNRT
jgi:hypothetical protein